METDKAYSYINLDYLNMMSDGDAEMKKVMLGMLFEEMPLELEKMAKFCAEENWKELSSVAHKMKSTLSFVGNPEMTEANKTMEMLSKNAEDTGTYRGFIDILENTWPKVHEELQGVFDEL
ncbi:MAG: Hpt domain-containing protein [Saprospiraceae bacterium]|nr:Hpt domain-containing protein [Saprospiraceae bacterium]